VLSIDFEIERDVLMEFREKIKKNVLVFLFAVNSRPSGMAPTTTIETVTIVRPLKVS
jgi:hypothetical protein